MTQSKPSLSIYPISSKNDFQKVNFTVCSEELKAHNVLRRLSQRAEHVAEEENNLWLCDSCKELSRQS